VSVLVVGSLVVQLGLFVLGLVLLVTGYRWYRFGRLIRDTPTSNAGTLAAGRVEVEGTARPAGEHLTLPFLDQECLSVDWTLEENVADTGEEWVERASGTRIEPFYLEDDTGRVLVRADEMADIEDLYWEFDSRRFTEDDREEVESFLAARGRDGAGTRTNPATTERPDAGRLGTTPTEAAATSERDRWRFVARFLPPGRRLYVFGSAEPQYGYSELGIEPDGPTGRFVIGRGDENWMSYRSYYLGLLSMAAGLLFVLLGGGTATGLGPDLL